MTFFSVLLLFFLSGCSILPVESSRVPTVSADSESPQIRSSLLEAVGVVHVHSTYSDGSDSIEKIARIAQAQNLDFIIITDHNTLQGRREGKAGWYGKTLVLVDEEISTKGGHYLALNLPEELESYQKPEKTVQQVRAAGGLGFVAHPFSRKSFWKDRSIRGMNGLEIYSAREDMEDENLAALFLRLMVSGADAALPAFLDRPDKSLEWWDTLLAEGERVVGVGSTNAHGLRWLGFRFGPYATLFKLVRNHLLIRGELTPQAVYEALEKGNLFVCHDLLADGRGFLFLAVSSGAARAVMGEEILFSPGLQLYAYLPKPGLMTLFRDGRPVAQVDGRHGWFDVQGPGVYRLEATLGGRLWIYSNPIDVLE